MPITLTFHILGYTITVTVKSRFYNKCWGSEAERQSYTQHFL